jgi:hypothetical protein
MIDEHRDVISRWHAHLFYTNSRNAELKIGTSLV